MRASRHILVYPCLCYPADNSSRSQVRNIVNLFIGRAELLENDETTTEHLNNQRAETEKMEKDKANTDPTTGGLFQGCFRRSRLDAVPFHDASDGVDRCPDCAWELEDGECVNCGFAIDMLSSSSFNSELGRSGLPDIPPEMATEMAIDELVNAGGDPENTPTWGEFWPAWLPAPVVRRNISQGQANGFGSLDRDEFSPDRSSRSSADEDEDSDEMNSFIDDDMDRGESEGSEQPTVVGGFVARDSSSFAQSGEDGHAATSLVDDRAVSVSSDDGTDKDDRDADDDDDDEQPIRAPGRLSRFRDRATLQPYPPPSPSYAGHSPHSPRVHRGSTVGEVISVDEDSESPHAPSRPRRGDDTRRFRR